MNRIGALIRYDWMLHKHNFKLTYGVIAIIYIAIAILYFISKAALSFDTDFAQLPELVSVFCVSFFNYAGIAIVIMVTATVVEKFCHPRTATAYLTLPGTSLEKFIVVIIDLIAAFVALKALFLVMFYLTMGACYLSSPELDWAQNGFMFLWPNADSNQFVTSIISEFQEKGYEEALDELSKLGSGAQSFVESVQRLVNASVTMNIFSNIAIVTFYLVIVMLFKTNVQIKAIGCLILTYIAYVVGIMITMFCMLGSLFFKMKNLSEMAVEENTPDLFMNDLFSNLTTFADVVTVGLYCLPFIAAGLLYLFYYQIKHKQAK